ncbi:VPA1262 family N-terminal domain-containing protein [Paraburkholderia kirstenboschensis]|uniref:VPA1262 family N-terminal domain-containing protein n=1 Tax=Paraburkholderia kirstenboschensis TaxID=1245436 RepID=A0ABZ0EID4_9BURK|nr:VPA1262 family N-terminal domain-containing protein [Paraburkholderia kirstenboschensis]WOD16993.1 VPA1262 family N-terminal domain-containing protein [Paraburkholderia kirstenboschensis]
MSWGMKEQIAHLEKLLKSGLIGTYRSFEVTEIVGFYKKGPATNFLSLLVAEPEVLGPIPKLPFLNGTRIPLPSTGWDFGVSRFRVSPEQVVEGLHRLDSTGEWKPASSPLKVGKLTAVPPQFVPADSYQPHPWNGILKNNFFDGSHVLELFDREKSEHRFLLDEPYLLRKLAELVRPYVPMGIDGLSDRIGNVLIQLPVTVAAIKFGGNQGGNFAFGPTWHPDVSARPLRVSWEVYEDSTIENFASTAVTAGPASLPIHSKRTGARYIVWDDVNDVILGASAQSAFFGGQFSVTSHTINPKTREFLAPPAEGGKAELFTLVLRDDPPPAASGPGSNPREPWRSKRIFRDSLSALQSRKEFVQYKGAPDAGRSRALADVRWLMDTHGESGVWLWDPYLAANDVLSTLFLCPWPGADLRGLSDGKTPKVCKHCGKRPDDPPTNAAHECTGGQKGASRLSWQLEQRNVLEQSKGNCQGLNLEFRVRAGGAGWPFHDRFLIFPGASGGAMAWSLGTSVNSLGRQHHILQKVPDGELIREAFLELWNLLDAPKYVVWKTP